MTVRYTAALLRWSFAPRALIEKATLDHSDFAPLTVEGLKLDFIPAMLRRRCSSFSKVTLAVAHAALRGGSDQFAIPTVFASTHGESLVTAGLLEELARDQQLSPMGFSLSVHNAASGLFSIATGNTAPSSAISAGPDCLMMGILEALTVMSQQDAPQVLVVCSDDVVAEAFRREDEKASPPFAVAFLLGRGDEGESGCTLSIERIVKPAEEAVHELPQGVAVARWLASDGGNLTFEAPNARWIFSCSGKIAPSTLYSSPLG